LSFISVELSNPMKPKRSNEILDLKDKKRWFSPKRSFKHEIGHAIHDLIDGTANIDRNENATEPSYEQLEDEKTIKENDQGDKLRNNHAGVVYDADCFDCEAGTPRIDTNKKDDLINSVSGAKIIKKE